MDKDTTIGRRPGGAEREKTGRASFAGYSTPVIINAP